MAFLDDDFLLHGDTARELYYQYAAPLPIIDYHCHLPPSDIAANRRFADLTAIWLEGDHYKWRAMRANGVDERYCTGDASPEEKFLAWARTVPRCLRNPLYHWTHLELRRYFGIEERLDERTAPEIWTRANAALAGDDRRAHGILRTFRVELVCTTDDPADPLDHHAAIARSNLATHVYPAFRADRVFDVHQPDVFNAWVDRLAATANVDIRRLPDLLDALRTRHQAFHDAGSRLSDHGLEQVPVELCDDRTAAAIFDAARAGRAADALDRERFSSYLMLFFGHLDAEKGWTKQLHLGAWRNANSRMIATLGRDTGYDSIGDWSQVARTCTYLDRLDREHALPRTILYNVNPADNYPLATAAGNFQDGQTVGKIQFGTAWWFLDQKDGMTWQLDALSNTGLLANFVGMVTDSRSFMSYPRHEYFRRILCNLLGNEIDRGELPHDVPLVGDLVTRVCYENARRFFGWPAPETAPTGADRSTAGGRE
ncbi:MAG TPA: glucuronate isomerase [Vicinamibacterales bacterium]|nr:glucuronate isomerase [Vicinamibacterales bacterium]